MPSIPLQENNSDRFNDRIKEMDLQTEIERYIQRQDIRNRFKDGITKIDFNKKIA